MRAAPALPARGEHEAVRPCVQPRELRERKLILEDNDVGERCVFGQRERAAGERGDALLERRVGVVGRGTDVERRARRGGWEFGEERAEKDVPACNAPRRSGWLTGAPRRRGGDEG